MNYSNLDREELIQKISCLENELSLLKIKTDFPSIYYEFFKTSEKGFAILDLNGKLMTANEALFKMLNTSFDVSVNEYLFPNDTAFPNRFNNEIIPAVRLGKKWFGEVVFKEKSKRKILRESYAAIITEKGGFKGIGVVLTDNTGQSESENDLKEYRIQLEELVRERTAELSLSHQKLEREIISKKTGFSIVEQAKRLFKTVASELPILVFKMNAQGMISYWEGGNIAGITVLKGSTLGRSAYECFENGLFSKEQIRASLNGQVINGEFVSNDKEYITMLDPLWNEKGDIFAVMGVVAEKYANSSSLVNERITEQSEL